MQPAPRCLYYAFGGGMGHGMRSISLARQLARRLGGCHRILLNSPFAAVLCTLARAEPHVDVCVLRAAADATEAGAFIRHVVHAFPPDLFVVDTFPRGIGGELARLGSSWPGALTVLISRTLPAAYVRSYDLVRFTARHYHVVIAPGEDSPFAQQQHVCLTAPFLIRDADELPARTHAARLLGIRMDEPAILVVGSGTPQECQEMHWIMQAIQRWRIGEAYALRLAVPDSHFLAQPPGEVPLVRHVPLMECLPAVRLVIGAGGYNLLHETAALQVPAIFWPRPRKYDDQFRRVATRLSATSLEVLDQVVHGELRGPFAYPGIPAYHNGAAEAARLIAAILERRGEKHC